VGAGEVIHEEDAQEQGASVGEEGFFAATEGGREGGGEGKEEVEEVEEGGNGGVEDCVG